MNTSNGQHAAQGHPLPLNRRFHAYGLPEDAYEKLERAKDACDLLQQLFAQHPKNDGLPFGGSVAALMDYLYADLQEVARHCAPLTEAKA